MAIIVSPTRNAQSASYGCGRRFDKFSSNLVSYFKGDSSSTWSGIEANTALETDYANTYKYFGKQVYITRLTTNSVQNSNGIINSGAAFSGVTALLTTDLTGYISVDWNTINPNEITLFGWVYRASTGTGEQYVPVANSNSNNLRASYPAADTAAANIYINGIIRTVTGTQVPATTWTMLAVTYSSLSRIMKLYQNNVLTGTTDLNLLGLTDYTIRRGALTGFLYGERVYNSTIAFNGQIDECFYMAKCITQSEIDYLYNNGIGRSLA